MIVKKFMYKIFHLKKIDKLDNMDEDYFIIYYKVEFTVKIV